MKRTPQRLVSGQLARVASASAGLWSAAIEGKHAGVIADVDSAEVVLVIQWTESPVYHYGEALVLTSRLQLGWIYGTELEGVS